jgi:N-acetylmuramoyl-L-alanine amidase
MKILQKTRLGILIFVLISTLSFSPIRFALNSADGNIFATNDINSKNTSSSHIEYKSMVVPPENYHVRKESPTILHILYTGESLNESLKTFSDPKEGVSVHYLISEDGQIVYKLVSETKAAHHAGRGNWGDINSINQYSIGIALVNKGASDEDIKNRGWKAQFPKYSESQIKTLNVLAKDIIKKWNIKPWNVIGHSDIAPQRKFDPGLTFPWEKLAKNGIGAWAWVNIKTLPSKVDPKEFLQKLSKYGYHIPEMPLKNQNAVENANNLLSYYTSKPIRNVVAAFQAHFRPAKVNGVIDPESNAILDKLIALKQGSK